MRRSAARAGLLRRSIAFSIDLFVVSVITSLIGIWLAGATDGSVRVEEVIGSRIHCTFDGTMPVELSLPVDTRVDHVARCEREFLAVPHDWWLIAHVRTEKSVGISPASGISVPLDPMGRVTSAFYAEIW
jgi:hypothetical protein